MTIQYSIIIINTLDSLVLGLTILGLAFYFVAYCVYNFGLIDYIKWKKHEVNIKHKKLKYSMTVAMTLIHALYLQATERFFVPIA